MAAYFLENTLVFNVRYCLCLLRSERNRVDILPCLDGMGHQHRLAAARYTKFTLCGKSSFPKEATQCQPQLLLLDVHRRAIIVETAWLSNRCRSGVILPLVDHIAIAAGDIFSHVLRR